MPSLVAAATGTPLCAPTLELCSPWPPRHDSPRSARLPDPLPGLSLTGLFRAGVSLPFSQRGAAASAAPPAGVMLPALAGTRAHSPPHSAGRTGPSPPQNPPNSPSRSPRGGVSFACDQPFECVSCSSPWGPLENLPRRGSSTCGTSKSRRSEADHLEFRLPAKTTSSKANSCQRQSMNLHPGRRRSSVRSVPLSKAERASYHFHWIIP